MFETKIPKPLKTRYEVRFDTKLTKTQTVVELDDGALQLMDSQNQKKITEDEIILKYATMCVSCNRRFFIEFPYEYKI